MYGQLSQSANRLLAEHGKKGFYEGRVAQSIVGCVKNAGGVLCLEDLMEHASSFVDPISVEYGGKHIFEIPPNGQGITALMALNILEHADLEDKEHNSATYLHALIEALRLAFADTLWYVADSAVTSIPVQELLSKVGSQPCR